MQYANPPNAMELSEISVRFVKDADKRHVKVPASPSTTLSGQLNIYNFPSKIPFFSFFSSQADLKWCSLIVEYKCPSWQR